MKGTSTAAPLKIKGMRHPKTTADQIQFKGAPPAGTLRLALARRCRNRGCGYGALDNGLAVHKYTQCRSRPAVDCDLIRSKFDMQRAYRRRFCNNCIHSVWNQYHLIRPR